MAKKGAKPVRRKAAKKKSNSNNANNTLLLVLIFVVVAGIVIYGLQQTNQLANNPKKVSTLVNKTSETNNTTSVDQKTSSNSTFNKKDIRAKDELVETTGTNDNIPDYSNADQYYYTKSFDFGWPAYSQSDAIVEHQFYTFSYNEKTEQPNWVAYVLTKENLDNAQFKRRDNFRSDPEVSTESASLADYKGSGYDRGHLAPAADFTWDKEALSESFFMSNMSPQDPSFNRGIWKKLEAKVRDWAKLNHQLYIVTGPITKSISKKIGDNKVVVPTHYYKAILDIQEPELKAIGFIMKNKKSSDDLMKFAISINDLEKQTGLDFFPGLPDDLEDKLEGSFNKTLWK